MNRRLIGESLPLKLISEESAKEKNITSNQISSIHQWFARRPLTSSRATAYASLIDPPSDKETAMRIAKTLNDLSTYDNRNNLNVIEQARQDILESNGGVPPKVLDPFGGGGAIPLECIRLGCETYSNDYNPVAYMIQKCTLEYPLKYGKVSSGNKPENSKLIEDIKKWSEWMMSEAYEEIGQYFPKTGISATSVYLWARTIPCQNPRCGATIPLINSYELDRKNGISLYPIIRKKSVSFRIIGGRYGDVPDGYDAKSGTSERNYVTCPCCHMTVKPSDTNRLLRKDPNAEQMIAVVERPHKGGRTFRKTTARDIRTYDSCREKLDEVRRTFINKYEIDPIPTEIIETPTGEEFEPEKPYWSFNRASMAGQTKWEYLYNIRQKLTIVTLLHKIRQAYYLVLKETNDEEYAKCITCYLGILLDRLVEHHSSKLCRWVAGRGEVLSGLTGAVIKKIVYYAEVNPFDKSSMLRVTETVCGGVIQVIKTCGKHAEKITCSSATKLDYPDEHFNAVFTDPPYYDFVPYSDFSDFYYVWLKRSIGNLFPTIFRTNLSSKRQELVANENVIRGISFDGVQQEELNIKTKKYYEEGMATAISEMYRVLKPDGILTLVYTHTSLDGWETLIKAIRKSGFVITAAWPLSTETQSRMTALNTASVQSSIYMVGRKWKRGKTGFYTDVKREMFANLGNKLDEFGGEMSRTDYFISAIGFALEWFTKYDEVVDDSGDAISVCRMLEDIRQFTIEHKMQQILDARLSVSGLTRLYILYRWMYGNGKAQYDSARKLLQGCGVDMEKHKNIIRKTKGYVQLLDPFERGDPDDIKEDELIDVLHKAVLLRDANRKDECRQLLNRHGYEGNESFYKTVEAIVNVQERDTQETKRLKAFIEGIGAKPAMTLESFK